MRYLVLSLVLAFAVITPALAQESPPALVVTLRDANGAGVAGVVVVVTDRSGATVLARQTTGGDGSASFGPLPTDDVRVQVTGQLSSGAALTLPGQDAPGIALTLGMPSVRLDLRSEADGSVRPDPASISLEPGVPLTEPVVPTAQPAATLVPTVPALLTDAPMPQDMSAPSTLWLGLILLASLLLGIVGVLLLQMGRRHA